MNRIVEVWAAYVVDLIKNLFKPKSPKFFIEYYPESKRYYPKHGKYYLRKYNSTGIIEQKQPYFFMFAGWSDTEEGAKKMLQLYKEQWYKENVITTSVDVDTFKINRL